MIGRDELVRKRWSIEECLHATCEIAVYIYSVRESEGEVFCIAITVQLRVSKLKENS